MSLGCWSGQLLHHCCQPIVDAEATHAANDVDTVDTEGMVLADNDGGWDGEADWLATTSSTPTGAELTGAGAQITG